MVLVPGLRLDAPLAPGEVCEVSIEQPWEDYLVIGGSMSPFWFQPCVDVDVVADRVVAHQVEHGHRLPISCLRDRPTDEIDPTARPPQR